MSGTGFATQSLTFQSNFKLQSSKPSLADGKVIVTLSEAYQEQWNDKAVRVIILASDETPANLQKSLLPSLTQIFAGKNISPRLRQKHTNNRN